MTQQNTWETALAERVVYVVTDVTLPLGGREQTSCQVGAAFDRTTGEKLVLEPVRCAGGRSQGDAAGAGRPGGPAPGADAGSSDRGYGGDSQRSLQDQLSAGHPARRRAGHSFSGELPEGLLQPWAVPEARS